MIHGFMNRIAPVLLIAAMLGGCDAAESDRRPADLILTGVNVIDVETGQVAADRAIVVAGGDILDIRASDDIEGFTAESVRAFDGAFAVPGLWDMHIHLRGGEDLAAANAVMLSRFLPYGVTGVRDAAGSLPDTVLEWREEAERGERLAPHIYTGLLKIDGPDATWPGSIAVDSEDDIAPALDRLTADGADFIKIYNSTISDDLYMAALEAAEARGLLTAAHIPFTVPFSDVMTAGLDSVEHAMYIHKAASPRDGEIAASLKAGEVAGRGGVFGALIDSFDEAHARDVFRRMAAQGMAVTPTLYIDHLLSYLDTITHSNDRELAHIPPAIVETYQGRVARAANRSPEQIAAAHARIKETIALAPLLEEEGVLLMAGSDTGAYNSYVYPGDSLHQEMRMMAESGMTTLGVLQAATLNGPKWLGVDNRYGTLEPGKAADILLLNANPLDDIGNTRDMVGLVYRGDIVPMQRLESIRNSVPGGNTGAPE